MIEVGCLCIDSETSLKCSRPTAIVMEQSSRFFLHAKLSKKIKSRLPTRSHTYPHTKEMSGKGKSALLDETCLDETWTVMTEANAIE